MNSNRTRYASTPTYGMQKRGFAKKAAVPQAAPEPDFTNQGMPDASGALPFQNPVNAIPPAPAAFPQAGAAFQPAFTAAAPTPGAYGAPQGAPFAAPFPQQASPFAAPGAFYPQQQPYQAAPVNQPVFGAPVPLSGQPLSSSPLPMGNQPLGNSLPPMGAQGFVPRQQGFVPQAPQSTVIPAASLNQSAPFPPYQQQPVFQQPAAAPYAPAGAPAQPQMGAGGGAVQPPFANYPSQPPRPPRKRQPLDVDRAMKGYLFILLPLLFIPCLFVSHSFDWLRYVFLALAVIGMSILWYRQMFSTVVRATVTVACAALCIITISTMLMGGRDVTQTSAVDPGAASAQATGEPDATDAVLVAEAQPTPVPTTAPGESEAELRLVTFMEYWKGSLVESMVSFVLPSWASKQENASATLFSLLANRTPLDYALEEITGSDSDNSRTITMTANIDKNNGKDPVRYRFMILMVKESGEWYVDPESLATNDQTTPSPSPEPGAVVATTIIQSLAPRMTVTPSPPPDTLLYYNANGGSFYHLDPECSRVEKKYLPMASFPYSELGNALYKNLQPCLQCGAPTAAAN
ncbi:MAG: hypothetical protein PHY12_01620 [Eubacteriales bacterium]|nr:hypothetical protein [Eubacteriales bacterium]